MNGRHGPRPVIDAAVLYAIAWLNGLGRCDQEIAPEVGLCRSEVSRLRRQMGIPVAAEAVTLARRRGARTQLERLGLASAAELRRECLARRVRDLGWPDSVRWREAQILDALAARGPMTRREVADAVGIRWPANQRAGLGNKHVPGQNYLAHLVRLGLVLKLPGRPAPGRGKGRSYCVYTLALDALDYRRPKEEVASVERT